MHATARLTEICTPQGFSKYSMHANHPPARSKNSHHVVEATSSGIIFAGWQQYRARCKISLPEAEGDPVILWSLRVQLELPGCPSVHPPQLGLLQHSTGPVSQGAPTFCRHEVCLSTCLSCNSCNSKRGAYTPMEQPQLMGRRYASTFASGGVAATQQGASQVKGVSHSTGRRCAPVFA